jgi:hypothetical protein
LRYIKAGTEEKLLINVIIGSFSLESEVRGKT